MRLEHKAVVITSVSSGIGKSMVELFVNEGTSVAVALHETNESMIDFAKERFGKLDALVNTCRPMCAIHKAVNMFLAPGGIETEISSSMGVPNKGGYGRVTSLWHLTPGWVQAGTWLTRRSTSPAMTPRVLAAPSYRWTVAGLRAKPDRLEWSGVI